MVLTLTVPSLGPYRPIDRLIVRSPPLPPPSLAKTHLANKNIGRLLPLVEKEWFGVGWETGPAEFISEPPELVERTAKKPRQRIRGIRNGTGI